MLRNNSIQYIAIQFYFNLKLKYIIILIQYFPRSPYDLKKLAWLRSMIKHSFIYTTITWTEYTFIAALFRSQKL